MSPLSPPRCRSHRRGSTAPPGPPAPRVSSGFRNSYRSPRHTVISNQSGRAPASATASIRRAAAPVGSPSGDAAEASRFTADPLCRAPVGACPRRASASHSEPRRSARRRGCRGCSRPDAGAPSPRPCPPTQAAAPPPRAAAPRGPHTPEAQHPRGWPKTGDARQIRETHQRAKVVREVTVPHKSAHPLAELENAAPRQMRERLVHREPADPKSFAEFPFASESGRRPAGSARGSTPRGSVVAARRPALPRSNPPLVSPALAPSVALWRNH